MSSFSELVAQVRNGAGEADDVIDLADAETCAEWQQRLMRALQQMMFVSGETAEVLPDTTSMIEEIVRQQVIEMVCSRRALPSAPYR